MVNVYLVRHGQSDGNVDRTVLTREADHGLSLTAAGMVQAETAAVALGEMMALDANEPVRLWVSPYRRTRQTADVVEAHLRQRYQLLSRREHINLCEQQFGLFGGLDTEQRQALLPAEHAHYAMTVAQGGLFWARMPQGESRFDVALRVQSLFPLLLRDAEQAGARNLVLITHGVTLRAFVMQWLNLSPEWFDAEPHPPNCAIYRLSDAPGKCPGYVHFPSDMPRLPGEPRLALK